MTSQICDKCGRRLEPDEITDGRCPDCGAPVAAAVYAQAVQMTQTAQSFFDWEKAAKQFASLGDYEDAPARAAACFEKAEDVNREAVYQQAKNRQGSTAEALRGKAELMRSIAGFRDADALAAEYSRQADELDAGRVEAEQVRAAASHAQTQAEKQQRSHRRRVIGWCAAAGAVVLIAVLAVSIFVLPARQYDKAMEQFNAGDYLAASEAFSKITTYRDSNEKLCSCYYNLGCAALQAGDDFGAEDYFDRAEDLGGYADSAVQLLAVRSDIYDKGLRLLEEGDLSGAQNAFDAIGNYEKAKAYKQFCRAVRVWNGEADDEQGKVDLKKAADILWKTADGTWFCEQTEQEFTVNAATRETEAPDLVIENNQLLWKADGVTYTVTFSSLRVLTLSSDGGAMNGTYDKV